MNGFVFVKFLLQISESDHKLWWEDFMTEFFHENATLAIEVDLGEGMRKFCESGIAGAEKDIRGGRVSFIVG